MKIKMVYLEHSCNTNKPANNSNNFYWFKILLPNLLVYHINNEANKLSANSTLLNLSVKAYTFQNLAKVQHTKLITIYQSRWADCI